MKRILSLFVLGALVAACGPEPKDVCAHVDDLAKKEGVKPIPGCEFKLSTMKDMKPSQYRTTAGCMKNAPTVAEVNKCIAAADQ